MLTLNNIEKLIKGISISEIEPWKNNDEKLVDDYIKSTIGGLCGKLKLSNKSEYGHYGSGYSSYVDCFIIFDELKVENSDGTEYIGVWILFSRLMECYVMGQGNRYENKNGSGSGYLPCYDNVDEFSEKSILSLLPEMDSYLNQCGWKRLIKGQLGNILPRNMRVPTILTDPPYNEFDAIFHWED